MATRIRNPSWMEDHDLVAALDRYVKQNLQRSEILDFVKKDFGEYAWSMRTLDRRLDYFGIKYIDHEVEIEDITTAVRDEMEGPGKLLGYRGLHKKLRAIHNLNVPRDVVYAAMYDVNPEALEERAPRFKKKKAKGHFTSPGPNWVHSLDGHDKLMGYQNSTFPLAVYGCIDTCSRKILWAKVWMSNNDPNLIGRFYLDHLFKTRKIASYLRLDKGTETGVIATMHCYLRQHHGDIDDPTETIMFGPSTSNQVRYAHVLLFFLKKKISYPVVY